MCCLFLQEFTDVQHTILIISPLAALIQDQYTYLKKHHINSISLSEGAPNNLKGSQKPSVILMSPESIQTSRSYLLSEIKENICGIVYDESHCVCKWYVCDMVIYTLKMFDSYSLVNNLSKRCQKWQTTFMTNISLPLSCLLEKVKFFWQENSLNLSFLIIFMDTFL